MQPIRSPFAGSQPFLDAFGEMEARNKAAELRIGAQSLDAGVERTAARNLAKAKMELQSAGAGGGGVGDWLGAGAKALGAIGGAFGWGRGGGSSFGSGFTSKNFEMPGYMSGAGNFSSFFG